LTTAPRRAYWQLMRERWFWVWLLLAAGCARSTAGAPDASAPPDAPLVDANLDAAVAQLPRPGAELVAASGRVRAGARVMEIEVGHAVDQAAATAGTRRMIGAAVVYP
jgi:hypothetical protein